MFAYCNSNPILLHDPTGQFGLGATIIFGCAVFGAVLGAFSAASTGGSALEGAAEGFVNGGISAICGLYIPNTLLAVGTSVLATATVDVFTQRITQAVTCSPGDVDLGRSTKTGILSGIGVFCRALGNWAANGIDAFTTGLTWIEVSALLSCADVILTNIFEPKNSNTGNSRSHSHSVARRNKEFSLI